MNFTAKFFLACGALSAALSVGLGAAGAHALHRVTPWGGMAFILGWIAFAVGVISSRRG